MTQDKLMIFIGSEPESQEKLEFFIEQRIELSGTIVVADLSPERSTFTDVVVELARQHRISVCVFTEHSEQGDHSLERIMNNLVVIAAARIPVETYIMFKPGDEKVMRTRDYLPDAKMIPIVNL